MTTIDNRSQHYTRQSSCPSVCLCICACRCPAISIYSDVRAETPLLRYVEELLNNKSYNKLYNILIMLNAVDFVQHFEQRIVNKSRKVKAGLHANAGRPSVTKLLSSRVQCSRPVRSINSCPGMYVYFDSRSVSKCCLAAVTGIFSIM